MTVWIVFGAIAVFFLFLVVTVNRRIIKVVEPTVGFLNLLGEPAVALVREDRDAIRASFYEVSESEGPIPKCDVLLIYASLQNADHLAITNLKLREIVSDSGAKIVIVASDNSADHYKVALQPSGGKANLVLTIDRRGWRFASFMKRLFEIMETGISMPLAWVRLAPQKPGDPHENCPDTLFLCELGHVAFKRNVASPLWNK